MRAHARSIHVTLVKWYLEILADTWTGNNPEIVIFETTGYDKTDRIAFVATNYAYVTNNGDGAGGLFSEDDASSASISAGTYVGFAIDIDAGKIWVRDNSGYVSGDPAAGTTPKFTFTAGTTIYIGWTGFDQNDAVTANFGASAFNYSIPSGFTAWNN